MNTMEEIKQLKYDMLTLSNASRGYSNVNAVNAGFSVLLPVDQLEALITEACRNLFDWRSSTRHYDNMVARWQAQGSVEYDKVIKYLHDRGYTTDKELIQ